VDTTPDAQITRHMANKKASVSGLELFPEEANFSPDIRTCQLLTTAEVAKHLRLSVRKIFDLVASGKLTPIRFGRAVRFPVAQIEGLIRAHTKSRGGHKR